MIHELLLLSLLAAPPLVVAADSPPDTKLPTAAVTAANQKLSARCSQPQFGVDQFFSDASLRPELLALTKTEALSLRDYAVCRTLQGDQTACASLEKLGGEFSGFGHRCLTRAQDYQLLFLALRGGDALSYCRNGPPNTNCAAVIEAIRAKDVSEACAALRRAKLLPPDKPCETIASFWPRVPQDCERVSNPGAKKDCLDKLSLLVGLRDPAKCSSSPACQALTSKSPRTCNALRVQFSLALCARLSNGAADLSQNPRTPEQRRQLELELKAKAEASAKENAAAQASVRALAEAEAKKQAKAQAMIGYYKDKKDKPQFRKGDRVQKDDAPKLKAMMKALEEGRTIPPDPDENKEKDKDPVKEEEAQPADR